MKCSHNWKPSHNDLGLFAWKCDKCGAIQEADPHEDQPLLLAYAQTLNKQFIKALEEWQNAPKAKKTDFASQVHALLHETYTNLDRLDVQFLLHPRETAPSCPQAFTDKPSAITQQKFVVFGGR